LLLLYICIGHVAGVLSNSLYIVGGYDGSTVSNVILSSSSLTSYTTVATTATLQFMQSASSVFNEQYIYISGG
jgi:hypothetical protein